jgi:hypothetical protein
LAGPLPPGSVIESQQFTTLINRCELSVFGSKPSKLDYALEKTNNHFVDDPKLAAMIREV